MHPCMELKGLNNSNLTGDEASSQGVIVLEELGDTDPLCCMTQPVLHFTTHSRGRDTGGGTKIMS